MKPLCLFENLYLSIKPIVLIEIINFLLALLIESGQVAQSAVSLTFLRIK